MMKRITISIDEDQQLFVAEKSKEFGNQSKVIREAIDRMRKQDMIEDMQDYFRDEPAESEEMEDLRDQSISELPDY